MWLFLLPNTPLDRKKTTRDTLSSARVETCAKLPKYRRICVEPQSLNVHQRLSGEPVECRLNPDVLIVGGGLAGLCCARALQENGISFQILEASDGLGGRVRTDEVDGYLLDRGFQVLLTAYPEAKRVLDYARLDLKPFAPGAISWYAGRMNRLIDPWRTPGAWWETLQSDFGTLGDKLRIARLRSRLRSSSIEEIFLRPDRSTKASAGIGSFFPVDDPPFLPATPRRNPVWTERSGPPAACTNSCSR